MLTRMIQIHGATLKRGLGLFLVVFILYGTTVEAAHRHGRILPPDGHATVLHDGDETATPLGSKVGCSDCLICQLHQSFNTTLISFRIEDPPSQARVNPASVLPQDELSQVRGPAAGRAPPFIS